MHLYIANVGTNDIKLNLGRTDRDWHGLGTFKGGGDTDSGGAHAVCKMLDIPDDAIGARSAAERLLQNYEHFAAEMAAPYLTALLAMEDKPDEIVFCYTDQTDELHRRNDTVFTAKLLVRWLQGNIGPSAPVVKLVRIDGNPTKQESLHHFYGALMRHLAGEAPDRVTICQTSGIPATNTALFLQAVNTFGAKLATIGFTEAHNRPEVSKIQLDSTAPYRQASLQRIVFAQLDRQDFGGAAQLLADEGLEPTWQHVLKAAAARRQCDWEQALKWMKLAAKGKSIPQMKVWLDQAKALQQASVARLADIQAVTQSCLNLGDVSGFVWRATAFDENALRLAAERLLPALKNCYLRDDDREDGRNSGFLKLSSLRQNYPSLKVIDLESRQSSGLASLNFRTWPILIGEGIAMLKAQGPSTSIMEQADLVTQACKELKSLHDLRNEYLHGVAGMSFDKLAGRVGKEPGQILSLQRQVLVGFISGPLAAVNFFDEVVTAAKAAILPPTDVVIHIEVAS